ncbi:hypothetical protein C8N40_109173 [Pontibacter mucosus]|uniref:Uncharacterized protein n=1 Tax=Pontibacter mucosus TaxID=1649266 RepID=A0A2T5YEH2_9BACT|nr:hypothetical protein [Pontibacter mucosus]PTX15075.1 hypothetical protein C8N40_109173 [Pontibacter mucosus]
MKTVHLDKDLKLFYVEATSFPAGVKEAFLKLEHMLPTRKGRRFFGIYQEREKGITYKAAVLEQFENEAAQYNCAYFLIEKGSYVTESIEDWQTKIECIEETFNALFKVENVHAQSSSIEYYKSLNELVCMVKLND